MDSERAHQSFPENTLFYRLDGVLFAVLPDECWMGVDDKNALITLSKPYADELARMVDLWELIDETEFRAALARNCRSSPKRRPGRRAGPNPSGLKE